VDFKTASLHIRRAKNGTPATHPSERVGNERAAPPSARKPGFPVCLRVGTRRAAIGARLLPHNRAGGHRGRLGIKAHAHMLRHACGYKLANDGHDTRAIQAYLGHRNIQNMTRYTALAPQRFKEFFSRLNRPPDRGP
jgi:integrase